MTDVLLTNDDIIIVLVFRFCCKVVLLASDNRLAHGMRETSAIDDNLPEKKGCRWQQLLCVIPCLKPSHRSGLVTRVSVYSTSASAKINLASSARPRKLK